MTPRTATLRMPQRRSAFGLSNRRYTSSRSFSLPTTIGFSVREVAAAFLLLLLIVIGLWTGYAMREVATDLELLERQADLVDTRRQQLLAEEKTLKAPKTLEALGGRLGLHPPADNQVIHLK